MTEIETMSKCRKIATLIYKHGASGNPTNSKPEVTGGYRPLPLEQFLTDMARKFPTAIHMLGAPVSKIPRRGN